MKTIGRDKSTRNTDPNNSKVSTRVEKPKEKGGKNNCVPHLTAPVCITRPQNCSTNNQRLQNTTLITLIAFIQVVTFNAVDTF
jgi:hypothetical protein